ncbi:MAG TPA: RNA 2',3'-cyclic phosphodiesterase [Solirubrobacteraceae bacterium]|jgi:2'-5' RNA ligase
MAGHSVRLFAAVQLPEDAAETLVRWGRAAVSEAGLGGGGARARVLAREALHLTLCFLGSRSVEELDALAGAVEDCGEGAIGELVVGAPVWLPPRRPRALAVEIHDPLGTLAELQARVRDALASVSGWEPPRGRFRAHVTVIRARDAGGAAGVALPATPRLSFVPSRTALLRSQLEPAGARYETVASAPLGAAGYSPPGSQ